MAWIESHDELEDHPKLGALAEAMGWLDENGCVDPFKASGHLHHFWKWCLRYAPTGDLHNFNDGALARAAGLSNAQGQRFVAAMTADASRWIDRGRGPQGESIFRVHDWPDYTRKYLKESRFKDKPEKWRAVEEVYRIPLETSRNFQEIPRSAPQSTPEILRSSSGSAPPTLPNPTRPNQNTPAGEPPGPPTDPAKREIWEDLLAEFRLRPALPAEFTRYLAVVKALHAKGAKRGDVKAAAKLYRKDWKVECTPEALVKWWDRFTPKPAAPPQETPEARAAREERERELEEWMALPAEERQAVARACVEEGLARMAQ